MYLHLSSLNFDGGDYITLIVNKDDHVYIHAYIYIRVYPYQN